MNLRKDALVAAALGVALAERLANEHGLVATVGQIACTPGGVNVIPGAAEFSLDIRSGDDALRDRVLTEFETSLTAICAQRGLELSINHTH
jgi:allantoate deiminase